MTERQPLLHIILASTRPNRAGEPIARWIDAIARDHDAFAVELVDLAEVDLPFIDEPEHPILRQYVHQHTREWSERVDAADAFVFVTPEYNYGFPATLKNALDFLFLEWRYKPVGIVSYGGITGGSRAVQMLKQVLDGLRLSPIGPNVLIPNVHEVVRGGHFAATESLTASAAEMLDELARVETALRPLRDAARSEAVTS